MQAALQRPGMETPKHQFNTGVRTSLGDTAAPSPTDGLKPIADGIRRVLPFGLPKGEEQHDRTRRNTGGDARSQVDPPHGGTGARAQRQGRGRDQSPLRFRGYVDGPASLATIPPLAALREARLNGFPGALAGVLRHHVVGARRRVSDTSATGLSDAAKGRVQARSTFASAPAHRSLGVARRLRSGTAPRGAPYRLPGAVA